MTVILWPPLGFLICIVDSTGYKAGATAYGRPDRGIARRRADEGATGGADGAAAKYPLSGIIQSGISGTTSDKQDRNQNQDHSFLHLAAPMLSSFFLSLSDVFNALINRHICRHTAHTHGVGAASQDTPSGPRSGPLPIRSC